jgi:hypothetical protein
MSHGVTNLSELPVILTMRELAELYRVSVATIRRKLEAGTFSPQPFDRYPYRWKRDDVLRDLDRPRTDHDRRNHGGRVIGARARPAKMKLPDPAKRASK